MGTPNEKQRLTRPIRSVRSSSVVISAMYENTPISMVNQPPEGILSSLIILAMTACLAHQQVQETRLPWLQPLPLASSRSKCKKLIRLLLQVRRRLESACKALKRYLLLIINRRWFPTFSVHAGRSSCPRRESTDTAWGSEVQSSILAFQRLAFARLSLHWCNWPFVSETAHRKSLHRNPN